MTATLVTGEFVHVVATVNLKTGDGRIHYVNPVSKILASNAKTDPDVELVVRDRANAELYRAAVVVRLSSPEPGRSNDVGLIQADIPTKAGMSSVALQFRSKEVDRYSGGSEPAAVPAGGMALNMTCLGPNQPHKALMTIGALNGIPAAPGVSYSVQVRPEGTQTWNTIAVGRATPSVQIDRNQLPGATRADVRVLRTTGFVVDVIASQTIDLF